MAELEMQQEPADMMSLNDALALMRVTAAAGGSAKIGPVLLARMVEHIDSLQTDRDALQEELNEWRFTNGVDVMRRELDQLRARAADIEAQTPIENGADLLDLASRLRKGLPIFGGGYVRIAKALEHLAATHGQRAAQLEAIDEFDAAKRGGR